MTRTEIPGLSLRHRLIPLVLVSVGALTALAGVIWSPARTWPNLLLNAFYVTSLAVSAMFFLAAQRLTGARWSAGLRRIPEAFMLALPVAALLMLMLFFGREWLYPWSRPGAFSDAPAIAGKVQFLKTPFVFGRMLATLLLWTMFAILFRKASLEQDRHPGSSMLYHHRLNRYAVLFALVFALSFSIGSFDWILSTDASWFSTVFALYVFCGTLVQGIAAVTLAVVLLRQRGFLQEVAGEDQLHDLGKMLFAFSTFWAYIWTCEFLLIWYADIPEEVTHYLVRTNGVWGILFALNFVANWIVPFLVLLPMRAKRSPPVLIGTSVCLLLGRWLDLFVIIMPSLRRGPEFGPPEILVAAGYLALLYLIFLRNLAGAPLMPVSDPILAARKLQPRHA